MTAGGIRFAKGHGTGNDFILLTDPLRDLDVTPAVVAALCDRRRGIGADGVLVVIPAAGHPEVGDQAAEATWFMDYRNSDGSTAAMCGNGARVFAAHLVASGLQSAGQFHVATRGGARRVLVNESDLAAGHPVHVRVHMGQATLMPDTDLTVTSLDRPGHPMPARGVLMPNPHAVVWVADLDEAGELRQPPSVEPRSAFPSGVNVEYVRLVAEDHIAMRVHERGVGETLSCGTGACAAAVATLARQGATPSGQRVRVDVPGGSLEVVWLPDGAVELAGPAVLVASGEIDIEWWLQHV